MYTQTRRRTHVFFASLETRVRVVRMRSFLSPSLPLPLSLSHSLQCYKRPHTNPQCETQNYWISFLFSRKSHDKTKTEDTPPLPVSMVTLTWLFAFSLMLPIPMPPSPTALPHDVCGTNVATGMACYVSGMIGLAAWEYAAVPRLKRHGILPDVPLIDGDLAEHQKDLKWMTPLTCDDKLPLPTLEELTKRRTHRIGCIGGVYQIISVDPPFCYPRVRVAERSHVWSTHYNQTIYIFKVRTS